MNMNFINAMAALNMITEGKDSYLEEYKKYIIEHKANVKKFANWLKENLPELFDNIDIELFDEMIAEHDDSKFSEEEFEAYAQHFYGDKKNSFEFDEAWKHHWTHNEHHPEFWLGEDMPYIYILEMLCDWGSFSIKKEDFGELIDYYYSKAKDDEEKNLSDNTKEFIEEILDKIKEIITSIKEDLGVGKNLKQKQLDVILKINPAPDNYHTWIRTIDDILFFEEALKENSSKEDFDPSYPYSIAEEALESGEIIVYSSYFIKPGIFVTPSRLEAENYGGSKKVYGKKVKLNEVAWIDATQGIYTGIIK